MAGMSGEGDVGETERWKRRTIKTEGAETGRDQLLNK